MMQFTPFPGYNPSSGKEKDRPPCGGYIGRIEAAETVMTANGNKFLKLTLDILEGRYTDWFRNDYESRCGGKYTANHRGVFRLFYPNGNTDWKVRKNVALFNETIYAIQQSNPGFEWDGKDESLVRKNVGFIIREAEWNGHRFLEIGKLVPLGVIRSGEYELLPPRIPKDSRNNTAQQVPSDLPF